MEDVSVNLNHKSESTVRIVPSGSPACNSSPSGSPAWGSAPINAGPCLLEDVMSEQLATTLQDEERQALHRSTESDAVLLPHLFEGGESDTSNDLLLAQMLQHEFDKQHDKNLQKEEDKFNGQSKVTLSFSKYRSVHPALQDNEGGSQSSDEERWSGEDTPVKRTFNKSGISGKGKNIVTKHDGLINSRQNARNMIDKFPPEFETGDDAGFDFKITNKVYNKLKMHSVSETKRAHRLHEKKEHSTAQQAVDPKTRLIMYKLINNDLLESVNGVISTGKESVVFHATGGSTSKVAVPEECAIKVYKTTLNEFKNRSEYVRGDFRFAKDEFKKQNPRKIIKMWAEKEEQNLKRMSKAGIPCPRAVTLKKHVLVMSFIGKSQVAAPKLKEIVNTMSADDLQSAYHQCVRVMRIMYNDCNLVHADLSEYNMLWCDGLVYIIDVSQGVEKTHPHALEFLYRDCTNVSTFFNKAGVEDVLNPGDLFNTITDKDFYGTPEVFLAKIHEYQSSQHTLAHGRGREFEWFDDSKSDTDSSDEEKESIPDTVKKI